MSGWALEVFQRTLEIAHARISTGRMSLLSKSNCIKAVKGQIITHNFYHMFIIKLTRSLIAVVVDATVAVAITTIIITIQLKSNALQCFDTVCWVPACHEKHQAYKNWVLVSWK